MISIQSSSFRGVFQWCMNSISSFFRERSHKGWHLLIAVCMSFSYEASSSLQQALTSYGDHFIDVMIIGGGPAGFAAGRKIASLRRGAVIMMGDMPGGQLQGSILVENVPGVVPQPGWQLMESEEREVVKAGTVRVVYDTITDLRPIQREGRQLFMMTTEQGDTWYSVAVIIATGGTAQFLEVPGEKELLNHAIFTCASCDGAAATDSEHVFVVGGGDASVDAVMTLLNHVAHCTLLVRKHHLRASPAMQQRIAGNPRVTIRYGVEIVAIQGHDDVMSHLILKTASGLEEVPANYLFLAIGHRPMSDYPWIRLQVACDDAGYIRVDATQATSYPGIYAAGEVALPLVEEHQVVYVYSVSSRAAKHALDYCDAWYAQAAGLT